MPVKCICSFVAALRKAQLHPQVKNHNHSGLVKSRYNELFICGFSQYFYGINHVVSIGFTDLAAVCDVISLKYSFTYNTISLFLLSA